MEKYNGEITFTPAEIFANKKINEEFNKYIGSNPHNIVIFVQNNYYSFNYDNKIITHVIENNKDELNNIFDSVNKHVNYYIEIAEFIRSHISTNLHFDVLGDNYVIDSKFNILIGNNMCSIQDKRYFIARRGIVTHRQMQEIAENILKSKTVNFDFNDELFSNIDKFLRENCPEIYINNNPKSAK